MKQAARQLSVYIALFLAAVVASAANAQTVPIRYRDQDAELSINGISDRTFQIDLAQIDEATGKPKQAPPSDVVLKQDFASKLRVREIKPTQELNVGKLTLVIAADPLRISITKRSGEIIQELGFAGGDGAMSFRTRAPVFGMGEGAQQFDRRGARYTMRDGWGAWERPTHGSWVAAPFLVGTDGWAMLVQYPLGEFDLRDPEAKFTPWSGQSDLPFEAYITGWDEPAEVMQEYVQLVGAAPLPPKWALGYMQSHRTLAGPEEVLGVARTMREKKLPCDALIYLGTGYCPAGWNTGHASVEFNPATFDKPAEIIDTLHRQNFHIILHQNAPPRLLTGDDVRYVELGSDDQAARPNRRSSDISKYWARHSQTFALGVDGWWPDDGDELGRESRIARHRLYYQGPLLDRPNVRPWNLQRTGYVGVQRYGGWIWTGDVDSRWATLAKHIPIGQNHSLSLSPYWGSDIGGFYPTRELTGELYVRWFQFGAFCPSFRAHGRTWHLRLPWGWNTGEMGPDEHNRSVDPAELHNPDVEPICRKYMELRYRLLPYTYTLCREAYDTGLPLIRALWLQFPYDPRAVTRGDEYLWGDAILVAPVVEKGTSERTLYLPEGNWYDFWTIEHFTGGREVTRSVDLATMPLYVRSGTILPLDPVRQYVSQPVDKPTTIRIYSGRDGEYRLYDDDGESLDYQSGEFAWTKFTWNDGEKRLTVEPDKNAGQMAPVARRFSIELMPDDQQQTIDYEGQPVHVDF